MSQVHRSGRVLFCTLKRSWRMSVLNVCSRKTTNLSLFSCYLSFYSQTRSSGSEDTDRTWVQKAISNRCKAGYPDCEVRMLFHPLLCSAAHGRRALDGWAGKLVRRTRRTWKRKSTEGERTINKDGLKRRVFHSRSPEWHNTTLEWPWSRIKKDVKKSKRSTGSCNLV